MTLYSKSLLTALPSVKQYVLPAPPASSASAPRPQVPHSPCKAINSSPGTSLRLLQSQANSHTHHLLHSRQGISLQRTQPPRHSVQQMKSSRTPTSPTARSPVPPPRHS